MAKLSMFFLGLILTFFNSHFVYGETTTQVDTNKPITISAAISLKNAFEDIRDEYLNEYPAAKIDFNFGASGSLYQQIKNGAAIDVFASADKFTMEKALEDGLMEEETTVDFAQNHLVLILPTSSNLEVKHLEDLGQTEIKRIALGSPNSVPAGNYAREALKKAELYESLEDKFIFTQNVRQALAYVEQNHVEAGFVYETDAKVAGEERVKIIYRVPLETAVTYPIGLVKASYNREAALAFLEFIQTPISQKILEYYGFSPIND